MNRLCLQSTRRFNWPKHLEAKLRERTKIQARKATRGSSGWNLIAARRWVPALRGEVVPKGRGKDSAGSKIQDGHSFSICLLL